MLLLPFIFFRRNYLCLMEKKQDGEIKGDYNQFFLDTIIASSSDAIVSKDLDGIILSWNPAAEKIFGYTAAEAIGKHISIVLPDDKLDEEAEIISIVKAGRALTNFQTVRKKKNGELIPMMLTIAPIRSKEGSITGIAKIARNISDFKLAKEKTAMLAALVGSSEDAIVSKTLDGIITSWNKGAEQIFGYRADEIIGKHITVIIPQYRISEEDVIINKIRNGEKIEHFETKRLKKNGEEIDLSITISPIKDENGNIIGASKIARDITEKVRFNKALEDANAELRRLNNYKDEFISLASHELNTPLTSLKVYLQILEQHITDDSGKSIIVSKALALIEKLARLIKDLLDVSKIESGKLQLELKEFNIVGLVDEVVDTMSATDRKHVFKYERSVQDVWVNADYDRIEQVFVNLISNAIKYSPVANKIEVRLYVNDGSFYCDIQDFGIGIPATQMHKLFTRFFRVEGLKSSFAGLGIGLYLCHQIVERHGGAILVKSVEGEGSVFTVKLPLSR